MTAHSLVEALAMAARECSEQIGLPTALEDEAVHAALKAAGHNLKTSERQRLGLAVGLHTFPPGPWHWHARELRVFCTTPIDPRPQPVWDECLWIAPNTLLRRHEDEEPKR